METLKFVALIGFGVLCMIGGVWMLRDGDTAAGIATTAFGALCVPGAFATRDPKAPEEPLRTGTVAGRGRSFTGLVITFSRRRAALGLAIGVLFTISGVAFALDGALLVGIGCAALFGLFSVLGVLNLTRGTARLVLTGEEIAHVAAGGHAAVRWDDVVAIDEYDIRGTEILRVRSDGRTDLGGPVVVALAQLTRRHDLEVGLDAVGVDPEWLVDLIGRCVRDPATRAEVARGDVTPPA